MVLRPPSLTVDGGAKSGPAAKGSQPGPDSWQAATDRDCPGLRVAWLVRQLTDERDLGDMNTTQSVAERIAEALTRHEVKIIFGQSVPTAILLAAEAAGIRQI